MGASAGNAEGGLEFEDYLSYIECLDSGYGRFVWPQDTLGKGLAQTAAEFDSRCVDNILVLVLEVNIDKASERWIAKGFALPHKRLKESLIVS